MRIGRRLYIGGGKAAKYTGDFTLEKPRYGYNWFYHAPHIRWNGGNPFRQQVIGISGSWLCYFFTVTLYPPWVDKEENRAYTNMLKKE